MCALSAGLNFFPPENDATRTEVVSIHNSGAGYSLSALLSYSKSVANWLSYAYDTLTANQSTITFINGRSYPSLRTTADRCGLGIDLWSLHFYCMINMIAQSIIRIKSEQLIYCRALTSFSSISSNSLRGRSANASISSRQPNKSAIVAYAQHNRPGMQHTECLLPIIHQTIIGPEYAKYCRDTMATFCFVYKQSWTPRRHLLDQLCEWHDAQR